MVSRCLRKCGFDFRIMGNLHSHEGAGKRKGSPTAQGIGFHNGSRRGSSKASSGNNIQENEASRLQPVEKLAKILATKSQQEEGLNGIALNTFTRYLFPRYPMLAEKLFYYMHRQANSKNSFITTSAFKQQCEKYLAILEDETVLDMLVKMFSVTFKENSNIMMSPESMRSLLMCAYHISMDHYSEGPQMCLSINKTLKAVVDSCFHTKTQLSEQFVSHWILANCPRLLLSLHRYIVHCLATSYRTLQADGPNLAAGPANEQDNEGLELATPVLDHPPPFGNNLHPHPHLLQMSMSWLLAGALPPLYSRPQNAQSPSNSCTGFSNASFLSKLLCALPSHWINLYDSDEMGLGTNRFLHHVLAYKGPTLCLLKVEGGSVFCICSPNEWRESHLYWGGEESAVYQLLPKFLLLEKGSKMLYLNTTVRGYPPGLRAGKDPRKPIIAIDKGFEKMEFQKIPYNIEMIEVWGCGDQQSREVQLDIKKWQVKEAERQRDAKLSTADWLDHPDRYLLELAGRPQYHQNQT